MIHSEYLKNKVLTVQEAVKKIKENIPFIKEFNFRGYIESKLIEPPWIWYVCENKQKCRFEIGGRIILPLQYYHNGGLELGIYIPKYNDAGVAKKYPLNDYVNFDYRLSYEEYYKIFMVDFEDTRVILENKFKTSSSFIKYIDNKNWFTEKLYSYEVEKSVIVTETKIKGI